MGSADGMILITGGSASGKSEYGESLVLESDYKKRVYIATMQPFGREAKERIAKHQEMRKLKNFSTVECYGRLSEHVELWEDREVRNKDVIVLFECISNHLSNLMFSESGINENIEAEIDLFIKEFQELDESVGELIIISNEIFADGNVYSKETKNYIRYIGYINGELSKVSQQVYEVVCGIPVRHKGER